MSKEFNVNGTCFPDEHFMVNIDYTIAKMKKMIKSGKYFYISRGRQYGKTTTLRTLVTALQDEYTVFYLSFEGRDVADFSSLERICALFFKQLMKEVYFKNTSVNDEMRLLIEELASHETIPANMFDFAIPKLISASDKPIVVIIDEVDQAGNYDAFIGFLGVLREKYLNRRNVPTFKSVILAGVYDIKNLKLKVRPDDKHQYNSPWNIAAKFDLDMSLHVSGIAEMLADYSLERNVKMDTNEMAQLIRNYTDGYPFLVSRLCQIIDEDELEWNKRGLLQAVNTLLFENNTLFDDITKKINDFPRLKKMLSDILYNGIQIPYSPDIMEIQLATMFGFVINNAGRVAVANRIFETRLYNNFLVEEMINSSISSISVEGSKDKSQFIKNNGLDMEAVLRKFVEHYSDIYGDNDYKFLEKMGRKLFLLYLRPIINGIGNYYIEAQTRDETRTDVIIDYKGNQYVVELKIWHGDKYNTRGEVQLAEYMNYFHLDKGYMLSFNFNKQKNIGVYHVQIGDKLLIEAVV